MKKDVQKLINEKCMEEYGKAMEEFRTGFFEGKRLRTCRAYVFETEHYWILKSYNTIVAVTSKDSGICYDVLRIVYGHTATSAQHIAKFAHDYNTLEYNFYAPKWTAR